MKIPEKFLNKKILIVDDTTSIRMLTRAILIDAGFKNIAQAKNGIDALKHMETTNIDLIICDWNMPAMNGLELFKHVHLTESLKNTDFIMLTSSDETKKVKEAITSGITSYILKPFKPEVLLQNIVKVFS